MSGFPSDIEIAAKLGLLPSDIDLYGSDKAKIHLDTLETHQRLLIAGIVEDP